MPRPELDSARPWRRPIDRRPAPSKALWRRRESAPDVLGPALMSPHPLGAPLGRELATHRPPQTFLARPAGTSTSGRPPASSEPRPWPADLDLAQTPEVCFWPVPRHRGADALGRRLKRCSLKAPPRRPGLRLPNATGGGSLHSPLALLLRTSSRWPSFPTLLVMGGGLTGHGSDDPTPRSSRPGLPASAPEITIAVPADE